VLAPYLDKLCGHNIKNSISKNQKAKEINNRKDLHLRGRIIIILKRISER
jgi:hypothetical protein